MPVRSCKGSSDATAQILKTHNLHDHSRLFDVMTERQVPADQLKAADILCRDLHARMLNKPLHALLGTKQSV
jgi:L-alanine-DL-glutamate epimerase-like enolase superfamily enzyme